MKKFLAFVFILFSISTIIYSSVYFYAANQLDSLVLQYNYELFNSSNSKLISLNISEYQDYNVQLDFANSPDLNIDLSNIFDKNTYFFDLQNTKSTVNGQDIDDLNLLNSINPFTSKEYDFQLIIQNKEYSFIETPNNFFYQIKNESFSKKYNELMINMLKNAKTSLESDDLKIVNEDFELNDFEVLLVISKKNYLLSNIRLSNNQNILVNFNISGEINNRLNVAAAPNNSGFILFNKVNQVFVIDDSQFDQTKFPKNPVQLLFYKWGMY